MTPSVITIQPGQNTGVRTHTYIQIVFLFFVNIPVQCFSPQVVLISRKAKMDQTDEAKPTLYAFTETEKENHNRVRETEKEGEKNTLFDCVYSCSLFSVFRVSSTARVGKNVRTQIKLASNHRKWNWIYRKCSLPDYNSEKFNR